MPVVPIVQAKTNTELFPSAVMAEKREDTKEPKWMVRK